MPYAVRTSERARQANRDGQDRFRAKPEARLRIKLKNYFQRSPQERPLTLDPCALCAQPSCALAWRRWAHTTEPYCLEHLLALERAMLEDRQANFFELRYVLPGTSI